MTFNSPAGPLPPREPAHGPILIELPGSAARFEDHRSGSLAIPVRDRRDDPGPTAMVRRDV
jgi:hypothetical protein